MVQALGRTRRADRSACSRSAWTRSWAPSTAPPASTAASGPRPAGCARAGSGSPARQRRGESLPPVVALPGGRAALRARRPPPRVGGAGPGPGLDRRLRDRGAHPGRRRPRDPPVRPAAQEPRAPVPRARAAAAAGSGPVCGRPTTRDLRQPGRGRRGVGLSGHAGARRVLDRAQVASAWFERRVRCRWWRCCARPTCWAPAPRPMPTCASPTTRYRLLRTHEWSDQVLDRAAGRAGLAAGAIPAGAEVRPLLGVEQHAAGAASNHSSASSPSLTSLAGSRRATDPAARRRPGTSAVPASAASSASSSDAACSPSQREVGVQLRAHPLDHLDRARNVAPSLACVAHQGGVLEVLRADAGDHRLAVCARQRPRSLVGQRHRRPWAACSVSPSTLAGRKFMAGEPMKPATNMFTGFSYSSRGRAHLLHHAPRASPPPGRPGSWPRSGRG